jgi:pseudaminic acid cytidylyltransferase
MKRLAIIPARGGSKRIPKKNMRDFHGQPIIGYAIQLALKSNLFDEVFVSTDDEEIAAYALDQGAHVPVLRTAKNSDDYATTSDVLEEVLMYYHKLGIEPSMCCCIYPTAPLLVETDLIEALEVFTTGTFDTLISAVAFDFPIQRAFKRTASGTVELIQPEKITTRSQDLETCYHDAGAFYFFHAAKFLSTKNLWEGKVGSYLLPETRVQDIDTETDWQMAELKYTLSRE